MYRGYRDTELRPSLFQMLSSVASQLPPVERNLSRRYFGEGIVVNKDRILQLTWRSGEGFVRDLKSLEVLRKWRFEGDGWGITASPDGELLYLTDGTEIIRILHAESLETVGSIIVSNGKRHVKLLNDIEYIEGKRKGPKGCQKKAVKRIFSEGGLRRS